jgi:co-chaperonin GroES (HSP10)
MKAIGKNIIIKSIDEEVKTASGLFLSGKDADQLRYKKGVVVNPGTDVLVIHEGDVIYYDKAHGFTMMINDEQYTIIQEHHIVVVV